MLRSSLCPQLWVPLSCLWDLDGVEIGWVAQLSSAHKCEHLPAGCMITVGADTVGVVELLLFMAACSFELFMGP